MTMQAYCKNRFIHRRFNRRKEEAICPLCGAKLTVWNDEDHLQIEAEHGMKCRIKNPRPSPAEELRYG